jgi:chromosome segregation ATPase
LNADTPSTDIERLYRVSPDRFTAERNQLAKRLRGEGDRGAAEQVAKLRKPTVAAWLLNQLARSEAPRVRALLGAAEDLKRAQDEALRGGGGERLREAARSERAAIEDLVGGARELAEEADLRVSEATIDRVRETLEAAVADPELADQLAGGTLSKEQRPGTSAEPAPAAPAEVPSTARGPELRKAERELRARRRELERAQRDEAEAAEARGQAEAALKEARETLGEARDRVRELREEMRRAERRVRKARS